MKRNYFFIILIIFCILIDGCSRETLPKENVTSNNEKEIEKQVEKETTLNIVTTNKFKYYMVKDIVKERHFVDYMFSYREKLWDFNYSEDSLNNISKKDLFFYSGSALEPWTLQFVDKLSKSVVSPVNVSRGIKTLSLSNGFVYKDTTIQDNPYFWMNIDNYKIAMLNIKNAIEDKDTKDREFYEKNFNEAIKEVEIRQKKLKEIMDKLKDYTFLVDGDELDYFTSYYGLKTIKIYNYNVASSKENTAKIEEAEKKLEGIDKAIYIYYNEEEQKINKPIIEKLKLKSAGILVHRDDIRYVDILDQNIKSLEKLIDISLSDL